MRSLYLRIFATIGLTTMLIVAVSILLSFHVANRWIEATEEIRPNELIADAARQLADGGRAGLQDWLRVQERTPSPALLLVIDAEGRELLDRPLPPRLQLRIGHMREWRQSPRPQNFRPPLPMPRLVGPGGEEFFVVPTPRRLGPFGLFGMPGVRGLVLVFALLITAAVSFLLARSISAPIRGLRDASRQLADGHLDARVRPAIAARRDELGSLGRDFDDMAARLESLMASRQELLRNISHELRTPLTRIRMAVELASQRDNGNAAELQRVVGEAEKLDHLIGQVLALAQVDHGAKAWKRDRVDLSALVETLLEEAGIEADTRSVTLRSEIQANVSLQGDAQLLAAAIENVLRNALRYTPPGDAVDVALRLAPGGAIVEIADRGPGVPAAELPRIFEPFHQVASARSPEDGGYGLGLAVTAGAARLHGGRVQASNREGGGLRVEILLGNAPAARGAEPNL